MTGGESPTGCALLESNADERVLALSTVSSQAYSVECGATSLLSSWSKSPTMPDQCS